MDRNKEQLRTIQQREEFAAAKRIRNGVVADNNYLRMMGGKARRAMIARGLPTEQRPLPPLPPEPRKYVILDTDDYPRGEVYGVTKGAALQEAIALLSWGGDEPCTYEAMDNKQLLPGWRIVFWKSWHTRVWAS